MDVQALLACFKKQKKFLTHIINPTWFNKLVLFDYIIKKQIK
jgi:hypothetical protein